MLYSVHRYFFEREPNYSSKEFPIAIKLGQIAPYTRYVVRNAPLLWTRIAPRVIINPSCLQLHLDLSRQCPLDIWIADTATLCEDERFPRLMPLLVHAQRWRRLTLWADLNADMEALCSIFRYLHLQNLEELCILCMNEDNDDISSDNVSEAFFRGGTPRLNAITLVRFPCFPSGTQSLTRLNLTNDVMTEPLWEYSNFSKTLSNIPSLIHLSMTGPIVNIEEIEIDEMATAAANLPHLKSVTLSLDVDDKVYVWDEDGETNIYLAAILALFAAAPLQALDFGGPLFSSLPLILENMQSETFYFPLVTQLDWNLYENPYSDPESSWSQEDAVAYIQAFSSVERVSLHFEVPAILDALVDTSDSDERWPHLLSIFVNVRDLSSILPKLKRLVEIRISVGRPLKELWLRGSNERPTDRSVEWLTVHVQVKWVSLDARRQMFDMFD